MLDHDLPSTGFDACILTADDLLNAAPLHES